jgi:3-oxoacyl-[acyl-carrier-protein] synthase II
MLAGGTGSRLNITPLAYRGEVYLSHRHDDPATASRPFDATRDGLVNGEGAATIVLEAREHAEARGANILGRVLGWRSSFVMPENEQLNSEPAIVNAIRGVLESAKLTSRSIGHVNAHGLGTRDEDRNEAQAIRAGLGDVPVFAPKSYFGNLGTGGGAVEFAASVLALHQGEVPPTLNYSSPDPDCPVNVIQGEPLRDAVPTALCQNQSGTGQAAAVIIAK